MVVVPLINTVPMYRKIRSHNSKQGGVVYELNNFFLVMFENFFNFSFK